MTAAEAADLRTRWKLRTHPFLCRHSKLELETTESGELTGNAHCIVCGTLVVKKRI